MKIEESEYEVENIKELLEFSVKKYGKKTAIKFLEDNSVKVKSYRELKDDSEALSSFFNELNYKEKNVAIVSSNSYFWIVSFIGIVVSQNIAVPVNPQLSQEYIQNIMVNLDIKTLIFEDKYKLIINSIKSNNSTIENYISIDGENGDYQRLSLLIQKYKYIKSSSRVLDSKRCCAIYSTSGTTGKSKGVMLSHKNLLSVPVLKDISKDSEKSQSILSVLPSYHIYCITADILHSLYTGVEICINDESCNFMKNIKLYEPSMITLVPMYLEFICNRLDFWAEKNPDLTKKQVAIELLGKNLKVLTTGGASIKTQFVERLFEYGINVIYGYGLTECPCVSRCFEKNRNTKYLRSVGKINSNCMVKIVENEIYVRGDGVMLGYYKEPIETEKALKNGWLLTGDIGSVDAEKFLYITGRKKNLIIRSNGENISPENIEKRILEAYCIKEVLVYADGDILVAEVYPDYELVTHEDLIIDIVKQVNISSPSYEQINKVIVRKKEFDKTSSKKIIREKRKEAAI